MSQAKTIYIIRHGQTEYNRKHIIQGSGVDSSLNDWGRQQSQSFYDNYKDTGFEVVLTSALKRTAETVAHFINDKIPHEIFSDINEINWGIHEGKGADQLMRDEYKKIIDAWQSGDFEVGVTEGETAAQVSERMHRFIEHLKTREEDKILVCSHGRAMRFLTCLMDGQSLTQMENYKHQNTGLYVFTYDGQSFTMTVENDGEHLVSLGKEEA